jgi:hypothetical protein
MSQGPYSRDKKYKEENIMKIPNEKYEWLKRSPLIILACLLSLAFSAGQVYALDSDGDSILDSIDLDDDNDGVLDVNEMAIPDPIAVTSWINQIGGISAVGNTLHFSTSAPSSWNSTLTSLDFSELGISEIYTLSFTLDQGDISNVLLGLNKAGEESGESTNWSNIDYAIYLRSDGSLRIYENGSNKLRSTYAAGDVITIEIHGTSLEYKLNGASLRTTIIPNGQDFAIDTAFPGGAPSDYSISDIELSSGILASTDTDNDGIPNHLDTDSDGDGIYDLVESGQSGELYDTNNDGRHDGVVNVTGVADAAGAGVGVSPIDSDNDGFYDVVDLDSDNDTQPDFNEHIAGTDPADATSILRIDIQRSEYGPVSHLVFASVPGRTYTIEVRVNLKDETWSPVHSGLVGNGNPIAIPVTGGPDRACYRLGVARL